MQIFRDQEKVRTDVTVRDFRKNGVSRELGCSQKCHSESAIANVSDREERGLGVHKTRRLPGNLPFYKGRNKNGKEEYSAQGRGQGQELQESLQEALVSQKI